MKEARVDMALQDMLLPCEVSMNPTVREVKAMDHYQLALVFSNGERGMFDCSEYLNTGVFRELKNEGYFRQVHVWEEAGTIRWPYGQDLCPDTVYLRAVRQEER